MNHRLLLTTIFIGFLTIGTGQPISPWDKWSWLLGDWVGEGSGQPGTGGGAFTIQPDLDQKVLVRKSHSEYLAKGDKPKIVHEDLMIIYPGYSGSPTKAIYFDNEGHVINYTISYTEQSIFLTSDKLPNVPVFRLSYTMIAGERVMTKFEISNDGTVFKTYIEGISRKNKK